MKRCSQELQDEGKPYPRTCAVCGLGPCKGPGLMPVETAIIANLATAILRLQHEFRRHRIAPSVITLSSWDDGQRLQQALMRDRSFAMYDRPRLGFDDKGNPVNQVEIAGTFVRWPATPMALPNGGFRFT